MLQETVWLGDLPVGVLKPGTQYYVNPDHLGSPRSIIDSTGATVWKWDRDPFGNGAPTGTLTYNLRFPGQYFDSETGLYYNMARDYDPGLGRYIQSDPIGLRGGVNTYAYVDGNPVNWVDPFGFEQRVIGFRPGPNGQPIPMIADTQMNTYTFGKPNNYVDPLTQVTRDAMPACSEGLALAAGATVALGSGSVVAGVLTHDMLSMGLNWLTGNTGDIPILLTPLSIPEGINPHGAY
ncbi:MAG: hypothetical protein HQK59_03945 [Deltaproteobacteria bacterium]|nr:hypothetical protein [Deltaproteobacteria bacterium]